MTSYEIAARHRNGNKLLISYTPHKSRPGLLAAVQKHSLEIIAVLGISESDEIIVETQPPHRCRIGEWCIVFTGRTEAQAKQEGELPFFNRHHRRPYADARGGDGGVQEELAEIAVDQISLRERA